MATATAATPTKATYVELDKAYAFFNRELFGKRLPDCLITITRKRGAKGYFWADKFEHETSAKKADEISLNPDLFKTRTLAETLSTLVHEMCHLEQQHFGKPSRTGYHNQGWADLMLAVGLIPSDTGKVDGKQTGQAVTHYIEDGGRYALAFAKLEAKGFTLPWQGVSPFILPGFPGAGTVAGIAGLLTGKATRSSKTKFSCPKCGANAWGKPDLSITCTPCAAPMVAV